MSEDQKPQNPTTVVAWPKSGGTPAELPKPIVRPCDWGLASAVGALETQLGTIEAYNRLVAAAGLLRAKIDGGKAQPQNPLYAISVKGALNV